MWYTEEKDAYQNDSSATYSDVGHYLNLARTSGPCSVGYGTGGETATMDNGSSDGTETDADTFVANLDKWVSAANDKLAAAKSALTARQAAQTAAEAKLAQLLASKDEKTKAYTAAQKEAERRRTPMQKMQSPLSRRLSKP